MNKSEMTDKLNFHKIVVRNTTLPNNVEIARCLYVAAATAAYDAIAEAKTIFPRGNILSGQKNQDIAQLAYSLSNDIEELKSKFYSIERS